MKKSILLAGLIVFTLAGYAQNSMVGQKAPEIVVENWIYPKIQVEGWQTGKVPEDLNGRIIILDFWFTKCAPCVASIPELNLLAKKYPEIVFLSVSFDKKEITEEFLNKMVIYYPVGTDTEKKTINAFKVVGYPETFLIDKEGIIQWQGSPFDLNEKILNKALNIPEKIATVNLNKSEIPYENSAYSFSVQKHNLGMGNSSYSQFDPYAIIVFNKNLKYIFDAFYGINKSRIFSNDSVLLNTTYDLNLKANKEITTEANCIEILKYNLPQELGLQLKKISKDTLVNILQINNDSLLKNHLSEFENLGTTIRYTNWEAKGATLENLKNFFENEYNILVALKSENIEKYDFILPINDFGKAIDTLKSSYGLVLKTGNQKTDFWKINKSIQKYKK